MDMEPSPGEGAETPSGAAQRVPSAHSGGSEDFEDHEAKTKAAEEAKEDQAGKKKSGGLFGALGFGKGKSERQDEAAGESVSSSAERRGTNHGDDDEEDERPDSESEEEGEDGGNGSNGSKQSGGDGGSQEEPKDGAVEEPAPKTTGIMGMFRSPFASRKKPADDEQQGGDLESRAPGTPPRKQHLSPRGQAAPAASSTRTAVQRAVERSIFVKLGRLTRVFWRDSAMQTGKEGSVEIARIAAANPYSMRALQQRVHNMQRTVMVLSIVGLLSGIVVNEWCWLGYIPTEEEEEGFCSVPGVYQNATGCRAIGGSWTDGIPDPTQREGGQRCRSPDDPIAYVPGIVLKSMCSALTGFLLMALFHLYECIALELCFRNHLEYHREFVDVSFWNLGLLPEFLLEFFVCIVHPGPRIHFNIPIEARGRMTVYNSESFLVAMMFMRLYTLWRYYREWMFMRYTSKNFASRLSDVAMDSKLALKAILADVPFQTITFVFGLMTFVLAYLVRIMEAPANREHVYYWNQLWLIVVTATSTGYGDMYPLTHLGRFVCILAMLGGILLTAVLITAVSTNLELNAGEAKLMNFLQSEHWEHEIKVAACRSIQSWWRRAIFHPRTLQALRNFKNKKKQYRKFLEATPHFGSFVESMQQNTAQVQQTLAQIQGKVVSGLDLGKLDKAGSGLGALGGKGAVVAGLGGNPVPSKVFEELMIELAQIRKANTQLKTMIDKGNINTPAPILTNSYQGGSYTPGRAGSSAAAPGRAGGGVTPGRQTFQRVPSGSMRTGMGGASFRGRVGDQSARSGGGTARSAQSQHYSGMDPAIVASKAVEERVRRLEIQVNNFDKGMAKCLGQIVRLLQGLY